MSVYLKHNFNCNTKDPVKFIIEDVADDNACCYRALANELNYRIDTSNILDYEDFFKPLTTIEKNMKKFLKMIHGDMMECNKKNLPE